MNRSNKNQSSKSKTQNQTRRQRRLQRNQAKRRSAQGFKNKKCVKLTLRTRQSKKRMNVIRTKAIIPTSNTANTITTKKVAKAQTTLPKDQPMLKQNTRIIKANVTIIKKPCYLNMTTAIFKHKLLATWQGDESIIQWLDTREKLTYFRRYAQFISDMYCLNYEQDIWQTYDHVLRMAGVWSTTITHKVAKENNLYRYLFPRQENVSKRQKSITSQLKKAQMNLNEYEQQIAHHFSTDLKLLFTLVTILVGNELQHLRCEHEWKKLLFQYDANDYRLVNLFYDLNPTEDQIHSAKVIWQLTAQQLKVEEEVIQLKQQIYFLCPSTDKTTNMQSNHTNKTHSITKAEEKIRHYKKRIDTETTKLLNGQTLLSSPIFARIIDTIQIRQTNMVDRTQHVIKHQIKSLCNAMRTKTINCNSNHDYSTH